MSEDSFAVAERRPRCLPERFFRRDPHTLARDLLGRDVVRRVPGHAPLVGRIVEVEVYGYGQDPASHANSGRPTARTAAMFGRPGRAYVYQIYGIYHCLNVVAPAAARPSAVLIRALRPLAGLGQMARRRQLVDDQLVDDADAQMSGALRKKLTSGPGKICQAMAIDTTLNEASFDGSQLQLTAGKPVKDDDELDVVCAPRVGLNPDTVGEACHWPWRYGVGGSRFLSKSLDVRPT